MPNADSSPYYRVNDEQRSRIQLKLAELRRPPQVDRFDPEATKELFVDVPDGKIRVLHHTPPDPQTVRPIVFVPGWGTVPEGFRGFFNIISGRAECYYVETREKNSSILNRKTARLDMSRKAADVALAIEAAGLTGRDYLLIGTCWGSSVIAQGLIDGSLKAPTTVLFDPMHTLWFPKWILKFVAPATPVVFWSMIRRIGRTIALAGMQEESQRRRAEMFVDSAEIWKWKRCAQAVADFELLGNLGNIREEVFIINGVEDKIHEQVYYPRIAAEIPAGRFFYLPAEEQQREELIALAAFEFASVKAADGPPDFMTPSEQSIR